MKEATLVEALFVCKSSTVVGSLKCLIRQIGSMADMGVIAEAKRGLNPRPMAGLPSYSGEYFHWLQPLLCTPPMRN